MIALEVPVFPLWVRVRVGVSEALVRRMEEVVKLPVLRSTLTVVPSVRSSPLYVGAVPLGEAVAVELKVTDSVEVRLVPSASFVVVLP